jgi:hypothetical protein
MVLSWFPLANSCTMSIHPAVTEAMDKLHPCVPSTGVCALCTGASVTSSRHHVFPCGLLRRPPPRPRLLQPRKRARRRRRTSSLPGAGLCLHPVRAQRRTPTSLFRSSSGCHHLFPCLELQLRRFFFITFPTPSAAPCCVSPSTVPELHCASSFPTSMPRLTQALSRRILRLAVSPSLPPRPHILQVRRSSPSNTEARARRRPSQASRKQTLAPCKCSNLQFRQVELHSHHTLIFGFLFY